MNVTTRTRQLPAGQLVWTTEIRGSDFGIPLVEPTNTRRGQVFIRTVRNAVKCRGGTVVWFTDGTKSQPLNGHTVWHLVDLEETSDDQPMLEL